MSRKAAPQPKPKPRGRQGGRKPRYLMPGEDVCMQDIKLRLRSDIVEVLTQRAAAAGASRDEYVMQLLCPEIMQRLDEYRQAMMVIGRVCCPAPEIAAGVLLRQIQG